MKRVLSLILLLMCFAASLFATHNRAGEIIYRQTGLLTFEVTIITYTKTSSALADREELEIYWGDGSFDSLPRVLKQFLPDDIQLNHYFGSHTYSAPAPFFVLSVGDPNRIADIINIGTSVNVQFYIEDTIFYRNPVVYGFNNSPILYTPPIDYANRNQLFIHSPGGYDPDGDSLVYQLVPCLQWPGLVVPNYQWPDQISPGPDNNFSIDPVTGTITWDVPKQVGIYNIAILVTEFRDGVKMGTLLRDMQIIVVNQPNNPPVIQQLRDTCVVAGSLLEYGITATDPDPGQTVTLEAFGGPFEVINPANFISQPAVGTAQGFFSWQTTCDHIRKNRYQVVFKAKDNYTGPGGIPYNLVDQKVWFIKVVAPPPENVLAQVQGKNIEVTWDDPYQCASLDRFMGFSVWRREGPNPFPIDTCVTGLAGKGYVKIAERVMVHNYLDENVLPGHQYCYRVLAEFYGVQSNNGNNFFNRTESLPSNESCSELRSDVPIITHVSVSQTDRNNGSVWVSWLKPIAGPNSLDTLQFPGPYRYEVMFSPGFTAGAFTTVQTFSSNTFSGLSDTTWQHTNINTRDNPNWYRIDFYSGNNLVSETQVASSVWLALRGLDREMEVTWQQSVPWTNYRYDIFRLNPLTGIYDSIAATDTTFYLDTDLVNDSLYCYRVRSVGRYTGSRPMDPILNFSQDSCAIPVDSIPPCPPVFSVKNYCDKIEKIENCNQIKDLLVNTVSWNKPLEECTDDILYYYVYYRSPFDDDFNLLSAVEISDTFFQHFVDSSLAGCYMVTAIDTIGNESPFGEPFCIDNCPCYILPNVFTPNGDGDNDYFKPFEPYRFVAKIDMKIYNRWGNLVFETHDPAIMWDGKDLKTGKPVPEGVYFYHCELYEMRTTGIMKNGTPLKGFIHLILGQ